MSCAITVLITHFVHSTPAISPSLNFNFIHFIYLFLFIFLLVRLFFLLVVLIVILSSDFLCASLPILLIVISFPLCEHVGMTVKPLESWNYQQKGRKHESRHLLIGRKSRGFDGRRKVFFQDVVLFKNGPTRICISAYLKSSFGPKTVVHDGTFESTSRQHSTKHHTCSTWVGSWLDCVHTTSGPHHSLPVAVPRPTL